MQFLENSDATWQRQFKEKCSIEMKTIVMAMAMAMAKTAWDRCHSQLKLKSNNDNNSQW